MNGKLINQFKDIYAEAAQYRYDLWHQDEDGRDTDLDTGGICDLIVDEAISMLKDLGYDAWSVNNVTHCWVSVEVGGEVYHMDIPPEIYEEGHGHVWSKIPGVRFKRRHVTVFADKEIDTVLECAHLM